MDFNLDTLKRQAEENPLMALGVAAALITSIAKLMDANSAAQGRRAYAKQVDLRARRYNQPQK